MVNKDIIPKYRMPRLPSLLERKIYKTGQTRGADDDVIYQNRVLRNSTVLIPFSIWINDFSFLPSTDFENGFIVLIPPEEIFYDKDIDKKLMKYSLKLGENALIFYQTREQWDKYKPKKHWSPANRRTSPLEGVYIARVPATTAKENGTKINQGFSTTSNKGAGIRVFEYADKHTIEQCYLQLESLFWFCFDSINITKKYGMLQKDAESRKEKILDLAEKSKLLDYGRLIDIRVINNKHNTICPLCLEEISGEGFFSRLAQAMGREVPALTVTEINLFHIKELRIGVYNHRPYNVGWGHHHCNVVTKDDGVEKTLAWMNTIIKKNEQWNNSFRSK